LETLARVLDFLYVIAVVFADLSLCASLHGGQSTNRLTQRPSDELLLFKVKY
jgi:hypothetical protein